MTSTHVQPGPTSPLGGLPLLSSLAENWWLLLLRGIVAIAFGILALVWPGITLLMLIFFWGAYAVADGIFALWSAISGKGGGEMGSRWWLALVGVCGVVAGLLAFVLPGVTALVLLLFIAAWAIVTGVLQVWGAIRLRKEIEGEWLLILSGLLSIAFGLVLVAWPGAGALAVIWLIGTFAIVEGIIYAALAFRLKKHKRPA
jgi:uncharacterized membrane protein HdeD (DUF308 family)